MPAQENAFDLVVHSGRSDEELLRWRIDLESAGSILWCGGLGDLDGDGTTDLSYTRAADHSELVVRSGTSGEVLARATHPSSSFGHDVVFVGDLNGDNSPELAISEIESDHGGPCAGAVFIVTVDLERN